MTWLPAAKFWLRLAKIRLSTILDSDDRVGEFDEVLMCIGNVSIAFNRLSPASFIVFRCVRNQGLD